MKSQKNNEEQTSKVYSIDAEGSLGLLAYGDLGLRAWREVKQKIKKDKGTNETN